MEIEELINQMEPFNIKTILEDLSTYQTRIAKLEATNLSLERGISFLGDLHDALRTQLNFSNATITELRGQLEKMAAERDSLKQQLAAEQARAEGLRRNSMYAVQKVRELEAQLAAAQEREATYTEYKRKLEAIVTWLEHHEQGVFARGLWDAINNPPEQEDTDENSSH